MAAHAIWQLAQQSSLLAGKSDGLYIDRSLTCEVVHVCCQISERPLVERMPGTPRSHLNHIKAPGKSQVFWDTVLMCVGMAACRTPLVTTKQAVWQKRSANSSGHSKMADSPKTIRELRYRISSSMWSQRWSRNLYPVSYTHLTLPTNREV